MFHKDMHCFLNKNKRLHVCEAKWGGLRMKFQTMGKRRQVSKLMLVVIIPNLDGFHSLPLQERTL